MNTIKNKLKKVLEIFFVIELFSSGWYGHSLYIDKDPWHKFKTDVRNVSEWIKENTKEI